MSEPGFCEDGCLCVCEKPSRHIVTLIETDKGNLMEKCEDEKTDMSLQKQIDCSRSFSESRENKTRDEIVQVKNKGVTGSNECNLGQMCEDEIPLVAQYKKTDLSLQEQIDCSSKFCFESGESKTGDKSAQVKNKSVTGSLECNWNQKCEEVMPPVSQDVQKSFSLAEQVNIVRSCFKGSESKKRNRPVQVRNEGVSGSLECNFGQKCEEEIPRVTQDVQKNFVLYEQVNIVRSRSKSKESKKRNRLVHVNIECDTQKQELVDETSGSVKSNSSIQNCAFNNTNKQETDLKTMDTATISSTPKVSNHRKRRMTKEKKTNVKKQRSKSHENLLEEPVREETGLDPLNLSLPTPKNTSPSKDSVENKYVTDLDEDLPEGLTPQGYTNTLHERDIVWVKWKKGLFLPAIVKFVYKKKKRVTLILFQPEDAPISQFTMNMGKTVFPYFDRRKAAIMADSRYLPKEDFTFFSACVERVNEYLHKTALKQLDNDWSFFKDDGNSVEKCENEKTDMSLQKQIDCSRSFSESRENETRDEIVQVKNKSVTGSLDCNWDQKCEEVIPPVSQDVQKSFSLAEQVNIVRSCSKSKESKKRNRPVQVRNKGVSGSLECNFGQKCEEEIPPVTQDVQKNFVLSQQVNIVRSRSKSKESKKRKRFVHVNIEFDTQKQELDDETRDSVKSNCSIQNCAFNSTNKQEMDLKTMNSATISSTPKVSNHRKRRMTKEKKTNMKKQRSKSHENLLEEPVREETGLDPLNLSLPTPKNTSPAMDSEESKSVSDSDEDLPEGLTPQAYTNSLHERDLVWVKWKKGLFLPAIVKIVYKKKKRVTLVLFQPEDKPISQFTMNMGKTIFSYFDPRKGDIMDNSRYLSKEDFAHFNACVQRVDEFLQKTALKQLDNDWSFFKEEDMVEEVDKAEVSEEEEKEQHPESDSRGFNTDIETDIEPVKKNRGLSKKGLLRKEKLKEKTKDLTRFLLSSECKGHLFKIFKREVKSEAHDIFVNGTSREKLYLKHRGFGPIDDDDQVESIVLTFHSWLKEINQNQYLNANSYVFDVWVPEAVVYGLKKLHRYSTKKAWEMFSKGVRSTKEELQLVHEGLIRKSPEVNNTQEEKFKLFKPPKRLILKS